MSNKDFFISYNKNDVQWAEWIAWVLEAKGYQTVIQAWDFRPGNNFILKMQEAASQCQRTIAVLSQDYLNSAFTQPEWASAFVHDPTGNQSTLLTVRVKPCELEGLLKPLIYIDLLDKPADEAEEALLQGVQLGRAKPNQAPVFPGAAAKTVPFPGNRVNP
ncbi:toll/interleukin-1 receptor domain-containing protein [Paenibacillus validus]|nr:MULTISPECIES: toll/interleukin-1 receptor domain-containing protein [Paenibacillus]MED4602103.1 toll/interleukin-1 receptor domain-containing protein [Paenibacillus validus]MED4608301.1 toll/interleukin-1 receptor domain-containing protein [Paenibacillus validus]